MHMRGKTICEFSKLAGRSFWWAPVFDHATTCGKPTQPAPLVGSSPLYTRTFEHCHVNLDCTNSISCVGDIKFGV